MVASIVWGTYLLVGPKIELKTVYKTRQVSAPNAISARSWMLAQGVQNAWVGDLGKLGKADCFSTTIVNGRHIFSYCKLRKAGFVP